MRADITHRAAAREVVVEVDISVGIVAVFALVQNALAVNRQVGRAARLLAVRVPCVARNV